MRAMRTLTLASLVFALGAALAAPAAAGDDRRGRGHDRHGWDDRHDRRDHRRDHRRHRDDRHYRVGYRNGYRDHRYDRPVYVVHQPPRVVHRVGHRGPPPWARGRHYGHHGYGPTYVVRDYGYYGLHSPPRGHYWRRSDAGDFLLVAAATGIIADLILHR